MGGVERRYRERLARAAGATQEAGLSALLITPSADLRYLTAYDPPPLERLTCLVVRPKADPILLVPELERPLAEERLPTGLAEVVSWQETGDPYADLAGIVGAARTVACSDRMWASHLIRLQGALPEVETVAASGIMGSLRAAKDAQELQALRRAARAADEAFQRIVEERLEGRTERAVADRLGELLLEVGTERVAFTIVGSGPNAASPHHDPGDRPLWEGDAVVMDFGGFTAGYCSDVSRTVAVGRRPEGFDEVYEVVREAQERAFRAVGPGVPAQEVDRAAREVIRAAGYGDRFMHRTGHGIGLEEHEPPYIVEGNEEPLRTGMCFSVEPGIYLEGEFGVRIEDIVTVTDDGAERLNHAPRELLTVR